MDVSFPPSPRRLQDIAFVLAKAKLEKRLRQERLAEAQVFVDNVLKDQECLPCLKTEPNCSSPS